MFLIRKELTLFVFFFGGGGGKYTSSQDIGIKEREKGVK